jgi:Ca-activated chloride channel family protein
MPDGRLDKNLYIRMKGFLFLIVSTLMMMDTANGQSASMNIPTRILFLLDASQSMLAQWQTRSRFEVARHLLIELVDSLQQVQHVELALRVFGHTKPFPPQDCDDTRLEVPFGSHTHKAIRQRLSEIKPRGTTPIARALLECAGDFPPGPSRNIIILITDGIEECRGDPCATSYQLQQQGISLKPFVIGVGISTDLAKAFDCVGYYFDASQESQLKVALQVVISQALNSTTLQVNLLDVYQQPTETNVAMSFYDMHSGMIRYNFVHTMNPRGVPDTLRIDPLPVYRLVVHTIPPVTMDSVVLTPGKHNQVGVESPQGDLFLKLEGSHEYKNLQAIVRKHQSTETLHVQPFNTKERYLTGRYDLEILTTPRILLSGVEIAQSKTTTVEIPKPGLVHIAANNPGYGSIYQENNKELIWTCRLNESTVRETIAMQPGNYRIIFRPRHSRGSIYTIERSFHITPGSSVKVYLY